MWAPVRPYWCAPDQTHRSQRTALRRCCHRPVPASLSSPRSLPLSSRRTQNSTDSVIWPTATVTASAVQDTRLCCCVSPRLWYRPCLFSLSPCSCECARALRRCDWAESRGIAASRVRPLSCTPTMERRRMDAALLVLLTGCLAAALDVPLDRKAADDDTMHSYPWEKISGPCFV